MLIGLINIILIISTFQLVIFSAFLLSKKPNKIANVLLSIFLLSEAFALLSSLTFYNFDLFAKNLPHLFLVGGLFCLLWGPSYYLYVRTLENPGFRLTKLHFVHLLPFIINLIILTIFFFSRSTEVKLQMLSSLPPFLKIYFKIFNYFLALQILFYNYKSLMVLYNYRKKIKQSYSSISKNDLSWLSFVTVGYTIAHIISTIVQIAASSSAHSEVLRLSLYLMFLLFFNIIFFKGWQQPELFSFQEENTRYKTSKLTEKEAGIYIGQLNEFMNCKKPYLNPGLTITQLASEVGISPRTLSQIINEYFNQNFYDYINSLRIEESKKMFLDSSVKRTVLEVLYNVGFNSKPSFNLAFKKVTGLTPSEFRKKNESLTS